MRPALSYSVVWFVLVLVLVLLGVGIEQTSLTVDVPRYLGCFASFDLMHCMRIHLD